MIFDLDGTLLDSMWVWGEVDRRFLARRGIALPRIIWRLSMQWSFRRLRPIPSTALR